MMNLIRYYSNNEYSYKAVINGEVYFSPVSSFNDPMDSQFVILTGGEAIKIEEDYMSTIKRFIEQHPQKKFYKPTKNDPFELGRALESIIKECVGVACFTCININNNESRPRISPAMFSHYGSHQTGFCCSFEYDDSLNEFEKVSYYDEFKHFSIEKTIGCIKGDKIDIKSLQKNPLTFKHIDWQSEQEFRAFNSVGKKLKFSDLGLKLKSVYLGPRFFYDFAQNNANHHKKEFIDYLLKLKLNNETKVIFLNTPISNNDNSLFRFNNLPSTWNEILEKLINPHKLL
ncbi:MAG: hypothetical protein CMF48_03090 [Legionellales bacterium]|nr:hypothetical protein [Legionellales bacterium]|tara:strand:+ start:774 stop:1634 length:861 start_codon:yes stop_codon:yes gene_type:complete